MQVLPEKFKGSTIFVSTQAEKALLQINAVQIN